MSRYDDRLERAEERVAAERDATIAEVSAAVSGRGAETCVDCGSAIATERRAAAPWTCRCLDCQTFYEMEKYRR